LRTDRPLRRRLTALFAGLVAVSALASGPALAQNRIMCSQPVAPTCVNSDITYEDPQRIDRCQRDLENYTQAVEEYLTCLEDKMAEQKKTMQDLKETFRCNANDDVDC
jgi:hypothetical protein